MKRYKIESFVVTDEWKQKNADKCQLEGWTEFFTEDIVNELYKRGCEIKQVIKIGGNFCTVMYTED